MHIKSGDTVKILSGKDRGKTGKVVSVNPKKRRAVVEGINIFTRHQKPRKSGEKGQILKVPMSVHTSNLMIVDPHSRKSTRTRRETTDKGDKQRISIKSGKKI